MTKTDQAPGPSGELFAGKYRLQQMLGEGGFGQVYLARHLDLDELYAIKVLRAEISSDSQLIERFKREAALLRKLVHPGCVVFRDFGRTEDGLYYLAMDHCPGRSLAALLGAQGPLALGAALDVAHQVLEVLEAAHRLGIVHRDIKPENLILEPADDGRGYRVRVLDFGLAKLLEAGPDSGLTRQGAVMGTPQYMSPEQAGGAEELDLRSDLYSLGLVLHTMLTGAPPFQAEQVAQLLRMQMTRYPPSLAEAAPGRSFPHALEHVLRRAIQKEPEARYQSAADFRDALEAAAATDTATVKLGTEAGATLPLPASGPRRPPTPPTPPPGPPAPSRRPGLLFLLAWPALFLAAAAAVLAYGLGRGEQPPAASLPAAKAPSPPVLPAAPHQATHAMSSPRYDLTATLLPDGQVLVTGGRNGTGGLATVELFDPRTARFAFANSLAGPMWRHTASLLQDGRVLVVGWHGAGLLFDARTRRFSARGKLTPRVGHTATPLVDGRILLTGGQSGQFVVHTTLGFDPRTDTFEPLAKMRVGRMFHTATLLLDGRVLVAGGSSGANFLTGKVIMQSSAELFDPQRRAFLPTGSMNVIRHAHTATLLPDGRVLIAGGADGVNFLRSAELYDPKRNQFTILARGMSTARWYHTATLLPDGRVLVAGGANSSGAVATTELFDPASDRFEPGPRMPSPRSGKAVLMPDGRLLIVGGMGPNTIHKDAVLLGSAADRGPRLRAVAGMEGQPVDLRYEAQLTLTGRFGSAADDTRAVRVLLIGTGSSGGTTQVSTLERYFRLTPTRSSAERIELTLPPRAQNPPGHYLLMVQVGRRRSVAWTVRLR